MIVALGTDHAGFALKARVRQAVEAAGHAVLDCGTADESPCDYPDPARRVGEALVTGKAERGILLCGSGVGVVVAANKIPGVRACLCHDIYSAAQGVEHDAMNVLALGGRVIGTELAAKLVEGFLAAKFTEEERHVRRLRKVEQLEKDARAGTFDV
jgi:ribose 5-phosphate isomerase B